MGTVPLVETFTDKRNIWTIVFYTILLTIIYQCYSRRNIHCSTILITSISLILFPFLPASNLFFPVGFVVAERVLYIPSFGYCMLIAHGIEKLYNVQNDDFYYFIISKKLRKFILSSIFVSLILVHIVRTVIRNEDWRTEQNIFLSGIKVNKNNAKLFNNIGHVFEANKQYDEALGYFLKAVNIQQDDIGAYCNVGRIYDHLNRYDLAEKYYTIGKDILMKELHQYKEQRMARIAPAHLSLFLNLANIIARNQSRLAEADSLYRQVIKMRSDYVEAYINRGDILLRMNRTTEANHIYKMALYYDNNNADIYYNVNNILQLPMKNEKISY